MVGVRMASTTGTSTEAVGSSRAGAEERSGQISLRNLGVSEEGKRAHQSHR